MKKIGIFLAFTLSVVIVVAQQWPVNLLSLNNCNKLNPGLPVKTTNFFSAKSISIPGMLFIYGAASLKVEGLKNLNLEVKEEIQEHHAGFNTNADDYLQFAPASGAFLLEAHGIKGKHGLKDKAIIYSMALVIMTSVVSSLKKITHELRPNGSQFNSFPSGHTANAFMGAAFLNQEYAFRSPVYGYAGYTTAAGTGILRIYNNKHWFTDVLAGAGIGILSAKASYYIFSRIEKIRQLKYRRKVQKNSGTALPFFIQPGNK